ncbi:aspartyl/asparaginyl beta-hydroxylase [Sphingomonas sp. PP-F2F-G114-C0414]|uniref:aspartyl/asparaginyl beta-hydroxylase domain-containing protein n=1 Tax=Sphingomonas sp. PP-F2F-G114-C0414 TaxID=2135662 RepID=UPI000F1E3707|nr:aspartyl/asparaginyl beta-hydroxylase domain-containing protein [Sphingomonas sp. PP-F2F-G114-C0414]RMB25730.1 aspartyl/asparaginyl beta-hydroxylase [Sphingomonas sp. PP-F2F-G114-C0414]
MAGLGGQLHEYGADARWPDRLCLPLAFDPVGLADDLTRLDADTWTAHFVPQHYTGDWSVLPLRVPVGVTHPILRIAPDPGCRDWEDSALLGLCPYFSQVLAAFACPIEAVRLMRLAPGSAIKAHRDHDLAAEQGRARLHIPVATNSDVDFRLNGTRVSMTPGSVWYLRLADPHSVINAGTTERVHLVIDAIVDRWLEDLLDRAKTGGPLSR